MVNVHSKRNLSTRVRVNGVWLSEEAKKKEGCAGIFNPSFLNQKIGDRAFKE